MLEGGFPSRAEVGPSEGRTTIEAGPEKRDLGTRAGRSVQQPSDADLCRRASDGDAEAFGLLFDRHQKAIYNFCFRRVGDWSVAEDLLSRSCF